VSMLPENRPIGPACTGFEAFVSIGIEGFI
jgi:hypothetical protein